MYSCLKFQVECFEILRNRWFCGVIERHMKQYSHYAKPYESCSKNLTIEPVCDLTYLSTCKKAKMAQKRHTYILMLAVDLFPTVKCRTSLNACPPLCSLRWLHVQVWLIVRWLECRGVGASTKEIKGERKRSHVTSVDVCKCFHKSTNLIN